MKSRLAAALSIVSCLAGVCCFAGLARAELAPSEAAARRRFIADAQKAHLAGDHATALTVGEKAGALEMTPSLRRFLAQELAETGDVGEAYLSAQQCVIEAQRNRTIRFRRATIKACADMVEQLEPQIARLQITLANRPEGLQVKVGRRVVNAAVLDVPLAVTPGDVDVDVTATGFMPFHRVVASEKGRTAGLEITLVAVPAPPTCPAGEKIGPDGACVGPPACPGGLVAKDGGCEAPPVPAPAPPPVVTVAVVRPPPEPVAAKDVRGLILVGSGVALAAVGTIAHLIANSQYSDAEKACVQESCTDLDDRISGIKQWDRVAVGGWIVGGALVATGSALYFFSGGASAADHVSLSLGPHGEPGAAFRTRF